MHGDRTPVRPARPGRRNRDRPAAASCRPVFPRPWPVGTPTTIPGIPALTDHDGSPTLASLPERVMPRTLHRMVLHGGCRDARPPDHVVIARLPARGPPRGYPLALRSGVRRRAMARGMGPIRAVRPARRVRGPECRHRSCCRLLRLVLPRRVRVHQRRRGLARASPNRSRLGPRTRCLRPTCGAWGSRRSRWTRSPTPCPWCICTSTWGSRSRAPSLTRSRSPRNPRAIFG